MINFRPVSLIGKCLLLPALLLTALPARAAEETIGSVKKTSGLVSVVRDGERTPVLPGFRLHAGDTLETGPDGQLGLTLRDDSLISLGPSSRIALEQFRFVPAAGELGFTARILRGTMAYVSGIIGRLAPESATFVTPVATIGVRGTRFAVRIAK